MLREGEPPQLPGELEGGEDGVLGRERDERGASQRAVRVDPRARVTEAVLLPGRHALFTAASGKIKWKGVRGEVRAWSSCIGLIRVRKTSNKFGT